MAHQAFKVSNLLKHDIDRSFGGKDFRIDQLEALLRKERELDALRQRISYGGGRADDPQSLRELLQKRMREYTQLAKNITSCSSSELHREKIESYLEARRCQLYLGDADRVRRALASGCLSTLSKLAS